MSGKPIQLFPYAVSQALLVRLADFDDPMTGEPVEVNDQATRPRDEEELGTAAVVYDVSRGYWAKLGFKVSVEVEDSELLRVLPATSDVGRDTAMNVLVTCQATKFRRAIPLRMARPGLWRGYGLLQRADLSSTVFFQPQLVRTTNIPSEGDLPYAKKAGTIIGIGNQASLLVDVDKESFTSAVSIYWEDFANSDDGWRREHVEDVYHLEPFGEPRLFLNSRYSQLREIMESTAKQGPEAAIRDLTAALLAQPVLMQLAQAAIPALQWDEDSNSVELPSGWRGSLLAILLPRLYPEEADNTEQARRAFLEFHDPDGALSLAARLGTAVQETVNTFKTIEGVIRAYESMRAREELIDA